MKTGVLLAVLTGCSFVLSCVGTRCLVTLLGRRQLLDRPNERSSHVIPTPRGGGIAIVGTVALAWLGLCAAGVVNPVSAAIALGMAALAAVSWIDDLRGLSPGLRLLAQFAAVVCGILVLPQGDLLQGWLPHGLDRIAIALIWVWFLNLFNFMDGI